MFTLIKRTAWKTADKNTKGETLVLEYKGSIFLVNPANFVGIKIDKNKVTLGEEPVMRLEQWVDEDGVQNSMKRLVPKIDFAWE